MKLANTYVLERDSKDVFDVVGVEFVDGRFSLLNRYQDRFILAPDETALFVPAVWLHQVDVSTGDSGNESVIVVTTIREAKKLAELVKRYRAVNLQARLLLQGVY